MCSCVVIGDGDATVTGMGSVEDPYVVSVTVPDPVVDPTVGKFVSTDGSFGLSAPTGVGGEFVIVADVLEDIRYDGNSL